MNLSEAIEPDFNEKLKNVEQGRAAPTPPGPDMTDLFWDFEKEPVFTGFFHGPGINVNIQETNVNTWKFRDLTGKEWLIPQWTALNIPQKNFQGFALEEPGKFIYQLDYKAFEQLPNGGTRHVVEIFRKLPA